MVELFRYIEQSFVRPANKDNSIDLEDQSDFQMKLRRDRNLPDGADRVREDATDFIDANFSESLVGNVRLGNQLLRFHNELLQLDPPSLEDITNLVSSIFDQTADELVGSDDFQHDKKFLNDSLIAAKLVTAYDRVNATDLASMRQAIEFIIALSENKVDDSNAEAVQAQLLKPLYIPRSLFPLRPKPKAPNPAAPDEGQRIDSLRKEAEQLKTAYEALMSLHPDDLEMRSVQPHTRAVAAAAETQVRDDENAGRAVPAERSILAVSRTALEKLDAGVLATVERANVNLAQAELPTAVSTVREKWLAVSKEVEPYLVPAPTKVYQLGIHTFAILPPTEVKEVALPLPDFSHAVTRPVGIGNLQVVKQELIGYEAGEVSHIENVLEGELYRRSTRRTESVEVTVTEEHETIQSDERDVQSTDRNEMVAESQKEASKQTVATQGQTTTTDYGKLVENSKTNFARSVTDRAVTSLTQRVKEQRIKREQRTFAERTLHQFDNTEGADKIRGIYQWVDKKYKTSILTYGERLLYDVVIPEPAAFLIQSLKNAQQPEAFQLTKPMAPWFGPKFLDASNYMSLARYFGATAAIEPPPDDFLKTTAHTDSQDVTKKVDSFGVNFSGSFFSAFPIKIPDGYAAVSGYIQRINPTVVNSTPSRFFEFFVGDRYFVRSGPSNFLNESFSMHGETGDLPVTFRSFENIAQFNYAIGINCRRTDKAYERWQMKSFSAMTEGYRRQLAEYEDKLGQRQAMVRTQMALAQNFARNPSVELTELKKAFIHLLMSESFGQVFYPTPDPDAFPADPTYVKKWGAVVAFFERAFEWENLIYYYYPYFWGRQARWAELILIQDMDVQFEEFLKAGAARVVVPVRPGFEGAMAHYHETGDIWMGEEMPDMFSDLYVSIIDEIKSRNFAPGEEKLVAEWEVKLPTTLVMLKDDAVLP